MNQHDEWRTSVLVERHWAGADLPGLTDKELDAVFGEEPEPDPNQMELNERNLITTIKLEEMDKFYE